MPRINLKNVIGSVLLLILSNISMTDEDLGDEDDESTADDSDDESALEESESDSQQDDGNLDKLSAFVDALSAKSLPTRREQSDPKPKEPTQGWTY